MKTVLCYGDSNTYGFDPRNGLRYPSDIRWTGRLQQLLGQDFKVIEEGCNGRTTAFDDPTEPWKNGLPYLRPCLNTHKPIDIVILMLGTNDLKNCFNVSVKEIAEGAGKLVDVIKEFTADKQGFIPKIILVSPPEIGEGIKSSPFSEKYDEDAIESSRSFPEYYKKIAEDKDCIFLKASDYAEPSREDSLHLAPEGHEALAEALYKTIFSNDC